MYSVPAGCGKREMPHEHQYWFVWDKTPLGVEIQWRSRSHSDAVKSVTDDYRFHLVTLFENAPSTQNENGTDWMFEVHSVPGLLEGGYYTTSADDKSTAIEQILDPIVESFSDDMLISPYKKFEFKHDM
ncbi:MAG: hypothetical protein Satyrvirus27_2 [Satyrvirus sp.]|uniref:Uncharacterized protein n=1 Tax=Satyrvirus sp. TaxID=2487771 RepID=A0A3G5AEH5_9VIRU|nr:MAG: hypothetical protein Satyrvirus27_2 [Satyrvirus sp.]